MLHPHDLLYNWKFVLFHSLYPFHLLPPLATTSLFSVSMSLVFGLDFTCKWGKLVFVILILSNLFHLLLLRSIHLFANDISLFYV